MSAKYLRSTSPLFPILFFNCLIPLFWAYLVSCYKSIKEDEALRLLFVASYVMFFSACLFFWKFPRIKVACVDIWRPSEALLGHNGWRLMSIVWANWGTKKTSLGKYFILIKMIWKVRNKFKACKHVSSLWIQIFCCSYFTLLLSFPWKHEGWVITGRLFFIKFMVKFCMHCKIE